jgi:hypothetical protein
MKQKLRSALNFNFEYYPSIKWPIGLKLTCFYGPSMKNQISYTSQNVKLIRQRS